MDYDSKIVANVARRLKIKYKKKQGIAYGVYRDFTFVLYRDKYARTPKYYISLCVSREGRPIQPDSLQGLQLPENVFCAANGYRINMIVMSDKSRRSVTKKIRDSVNAVVEYMVENGYSDSDEKGEVGHPSVYIVDERICFLLDESVDEAYQAMLYDSLLTKLKHKFAMSKNCREAIIISLIASIFCTIILYVVARIFDFAGIAGLIIGIVSLGCYITIDRHYSVFGFVVCAIFNIIVLYIFFRIYVAADLQQICEEWRRYVSFQTCLLHPKMVLEQYSMLSEIAEYDYNRQWYTIIGIYIFTVLIYGQTYFSEKKQEEEERQKHDRYKLD